MTNADLLRALRDCFDPATRRDVVALGLVRSATLLLDPDAPGAAIAGAAPRYIARVTLDTPSADAAHQQQLRAIVANRLAGIAAISRSEITLQAPLLPILR